METDDIVINEEVSDGDAEVMDENSDSETTAILQEIYNLLSASNEDEEEEIEVASVDGVDLGTGYINSSALTYLTACATNYGSNAWYVIYPIADSTSSSTATYNSAVMYIGYSYSLDGNSLTIYDATQIQIRRTTVSNSTTYVKTIDEVGDVNITLSEDGFFYTNCAKGYAALDLTLERQQTVLNVSCLLLGAMILGMFALIWRTNKHGQ